MSLQRRFVFLVLALALAAVPSAANDRAAGGDDHVGKPLPDYVTGDECLFCHRADIGPTWQQNRHGQTIRLAGTAPAAVNRLKESPELAEFAAQAEYVMGRGRAVRFLKTGEGYGKLDLLTALVRPAKEGEGGEIANAAHPVWDSGKFANQCAGCHATAVEAESRGFAAFSLDCYACHGSVSLTHSEDAALVLLSRKREDPPELIASICGQCHLRGAKSRSLGTPYPNQFVAGDNLFRDFEADFSDEALAAMTPGERHVFRNVRDMTADPPSKITCVKCHDVHTNSSEKHAGIGWNALCADCHVKDKPRRETIPYERGSPVCEY